MLVVKVELHSAITGQVKEIGRVVVCNDGTQHGTRGSYNVFQLRPNRPNTKLIPGWFDKPVRTGEVKNHARLRNPVWNLIRKALEALRH